MLLAHSCAYAHASQSPVWFAARSSHFEVYSETGAESARSTLARFERLRTFFAQNKLLDFGPSLNAGPPLRIISFRSAKEYDAFRLRANADAYYISSEGQGYIVMLTPQSQDFAIGAHEYTHSVLHAGALRLPAWLNEGLAEFFSTVRISSGGCQLGGTLPGRMQTLTHYKWLPLEQLLALPEAAAVQTREGAEIFYAESWALTDLLVDSPEYAPHFHDLINALSSGKPSAQAVTSVYAKSLAAIANDWQVWVGKHESKPRDFGAIPQMPVTVRVSEVPKFQANALMAELLLAEGKLDPAKSLYTELEHERPGNPHVLAALGMIALRKQDRATAILCWRQAIDKGINDAGLCYRYALLLDEAGAPVDKIRSALEQAVALSPGFEDARFKLALLENNAGNFAAALTQLRAMHTVPASRAYGYWSAMSYASMELGDREEGKNAAQQAIKSAQTSSERLRAAQLAYVAETDLTVQFATAADGHSRLVTTRVPHGTANWNPFIEPTDHIERAVGQLREVLCAGGQMRGLVVDTSHGPLSLAVPDPLHVLMRNGPAEFACGPQHAKNVKVEYAASNANAETEGVLRGIEFP